jgi:hypothetical protein
MTQTTHRAAAGVSGHGRNYFHLSSFGVRLSRRAVPHVNTLEFPCIAPPAPRRSSLR